FFPPVDQGIRYCALSGSSSGREYVVDAPLEWIKALIGHWRLAAGAGQVLLIALELPVFVSLFSTLERHDTVIAVTDNAGLDACVELEEEVVTHAAFTVAWLGDHDKRTGARPLNKWCFRMSPGERNRAKPGNLESYEPNLGSGSDWLARWVTRRELGLSLSAGAARGFAHLGVLHVLEQAGVPIDCISGTSMGGIVALVYAMTGSAEQSIHVIRELLGGNRKVRDLAFVPRGSLYSGKKVSRAARDFFGEIQIAELKKPCAVIAVDLVRGERLVINKGLVAEAVLATSAIPGLFPPVERDGRLLIDGALMSRIPLDVLDGQRCGLRLAVNVVPSPETRKQEAEETLTWLKARGASFLGLRFIIGFSWELQAWTHGANEAESADLLIEPDSHIYSGYDFDRFDDMVNAGREAAEEKLELINASVAALLKPGVP
ncbi:MAG: patatin-like phospholipase family protein, partial [Pseudomonadota bacterium]